MGKHKTGTGIEGERARTREGARPSFTLVPKNKDEECQKYHETASGALGDSEARRRNAFGSLLAIVLTAAGSVRVRGGGRGWVGVEGRRELCSFCFPVVSIGTCCFLFSVGGN